VWDCTSSDTWTPTIPNASGSPGYQVIFFE
jgi:hypothetical protein